MSTQPERLKAPAHCSPADQFEGMRHMWKAVACAALVDEAEKISNAAPADRESLIQTAMRYFRRNEFATVCALGGFTPSPKAIEAWLRSGQLQTTMRGNMGALGLRGAA